MPLLCRPRHGQVLEIEYLSPWITEVGYPRKSCFCSQPAPYQMHGLRRACAHDQVYRMLLKVLLEIFYRRSYPEAARVRTEKISSHPHGHLLEGGFVLCIDRIHLDGFLAVPRPAEDLLVKLIRLQNACLYDLGFSRHFGLQRRVDRQLLRVFRRVDHRLPSLGRKVLGELHPALHSRTSCRRPIIRYDKDTFHKRTKIANNIVKPPGALGFFDSGLYVPDVQSFPMSYVPSKGSTWE